MDRSEIVIFAIAAFTLFMSFSSHADIMALIRQDQSLELAPKNLRHSLPVKIENATGLFMIDQAAADLVLSREFIAKNNLWDYHFVREVNGGDLVEFKTVSVGSWTLNDVQAVICDDCTPLAGRSLLNYFRLESIDRDGVEYLSVKR